MRALRDPELSGSSVYVTISDSTHDPIHHCPPSFVPLAGMLDELGINTPGELRGYITKRSLPVLAASVLETLLSGVGAAASLYIWAVLPWDALILMERGVWPWAAAALTGFGQGVALFSGAMFTASALFSTVTLFATLYATLAFDVNARGFMNSVARRSGGIGIGAFEAGPRAAASLDVLKKLQEMREMLMFRAAQRATAPPSGSLAVHLAALADMQSGGRGLGLAALALAPSEAATLARLFARFDADGDDKLDVGELRAMMAELTPHKNVSLEAATAALHLLDVDGDGLVELDEFAAWYGSFRLMHQRSEQLEQSGDGGGTRTQVDEQMKVEEKQEEKKEV